MDTRNPSALGEAITKFRLVAANKAKADNKLLELMRHPKATAEQLMQAHESAVRVEQMMRETVTALREKWGARSTVFVTRWNQPEYDKYDDRGKQ